LAVATSFLGFYTIHDAFEANLKIDMAMHEGRKLLHYLDEYDAYTDVPFYKYYTMLDEQYPESLFILSKRDPYKWIRSRMALDALVAKKLPDRQSDEPRMKNSEKMLEFMETHHRNVEKHFHDKPNLLTIDVCAGEGWEKLCPFLDRPVPDRPFPKMNVFTYA
jgi:hypothetical protein